MPGKGGIPGRLSASHLLLHFVALFILWPMTAINAQAPTKTPPTPLPYANTEMEESRETRSNWQRIQERGALILGMLYNREPFGWLDIRGNVTGYDADILRSVAELWGVELQFRQVTRHTAAELLRAGEVDLLAGGQLLLSERLAEFAFSHVYHRDAVQILVRADSSWQTKGDLLGQTLGYQSASPLAQFITDWSQRANLAYQFRPQPTLDYGLRALLSGDIEALAGTRSQLELLAPEPGKTRPLAESPGALPLAFALPLSDSILRDALNHALQTLTANGRLRELHTLYFPHIPLAAELIPIWRDLSADEAFVAETVIRYPKEFTLPRLRENGVLRVTLLPSSHAAVAELYAGLANALGEWWQLPVEFVETGGAPALNSLIAGSVDLIIGAEPRWSDSARADFSIPFWREGTLLLTREASDYRRFSDLPESVTIAMAAEEQEWREDLLARLAAAERDLEELRVLNSSILANEILADESVDAIYGSLPLLLPLLRDYPDRFRITELDDGGNYISRRFHSIATQENDHEFRHLVELSLQELALDGTLDSLLEPFTRADIQGSGHGIFPWPGGGFSIPVFVNDN